MCKEKVGVNRRRFLKTAAKAGVCLAIPQIIPASALGKNGSVPPSERIRLGCIGIGNRGRYVLSCFLQQPDLHCVAVCDVRGDNRQRAKNQIDAANGDKACDTYIDFRELLARDDIDAVSVTTPDHWHA
ncbi:MAG: Gfo/Idh/MocA family oxidoreductase, partial [Planctomycetes bacterium]|nr:Gfo/Idh/MocA family oxidoreductase [Planctomycetota bacterium]